MSTLVRLALCSLVLAPLWAGNADTETQTEKPQEKVETTNGDEPGVVDHMEEMVVTAGGEAQSRWQVPLAVARVDGREIREKQAQHPSEILGRVAGVWVNTTGGEGHMTAIRQPLSTSPLYLFLENGVPTRSTGFFNHNALYEVNLPMADGIEVIKGPGTALHGSDAIGGVVNVHSRRAPLSRELEVSMEAAENGYGRLLFTGGDRLGQHGYRVDANQTHSDGWRDGTAYDRSSASLTWEHQTETRSIRALLTYAKIEQDTAGSSAISEEDYLHHPEINYTPISLRNVDALRLSVAMDWLVGNRGLLSITPFARDNSMDLLPNWSLSYDPALWETGNKSIGVMTRYRVDLEPAHTRLIVGIDADHSPGEHREWRVDPSRVDGIYTDYTLGEAIYDYDVDFTGTAAYAQVEMNPLGALQVSLGLRYDHMAYDYETRLTPTSSGRWRVPESTDVAYDKLSPKLGFSWRIGERLNLFASYRRAFRAPSEGQLFRQGSSADTLGLKPVNARNMDLGLRGRLGTVQYELTGYHLVKEDDILGYQDPETGVRTSVNAGETLHRGLELELSSRIGQLLTARLSLSRARHTYEEWVLNEGTSYSGNEMESAPRILANLALDVRPAFLGGGPISLEWRKLGAYWMDPANSERYEGHDLLNLRASWVISEAFSLSAQVRNLGDKRHAERASYNAFRGREYAPGMPRAASLNLRYTWR